jgi:hypothetical protein
MQKYPSKCIEKRRAGSGKRVDGATVKATILNQLVIWFEDRLSF